MENISYKAIDNLEIMSSAKNYNRFILNRIMLYAYGLETLDFGAGTGYFAEELSKRGYDVKCVEVDDLLRKKIMESGLFVYSTIDSIRNETAPYIYSLNVLEYIEDDRAILRRLYQKLKPGGRLFLYVPAFNFLFSSMDRKVGHHRRYDLKGLVEKLKEAGLSVREAFYTDTIGFLFSLLYKYFGNPNGDLGSIQMFIYDRFLFPLNSLLDPLFRKILGKNIIIIAEKT